MIDVAGKVLRILEKLHGIGVLYGDLKPGNLLADENGDIFLVDFNSAIFIDRESRSRGWSYAFAAPEQFETDGVLSFAADVYSLGRTMEYLLSPEDFDRYRREYYVRRVPVRLYRPDVSPGLEAVLTKMTDPIPSRRYQSAEEVLEALDRCGREAPLRKLRLRIASRRRLRAFSAGAVLDEQERAAAIRRMTSSAGRRSDADVTVLLNGETLMLGGETVMTVPDGDTVPPPVHTVPPFVGTALPFPFTVPPFDDDTYFPADGTDDAAGGGTDGAPDDTDGGAEDPPD